MRSFGSGVRRPVFVDDSGRRHRAARLVGAATGGLALVYLGVVGATFAGVPGLGRLTAPGLGQLTNPAGAQTDVGQHPLEQAVPAALAEPLAEEAPPPETTPLSTAATTTTSSEPATTTTTQLPPATTTTTVHGNGQTPNSTIPEHGGGRPTSKP